MLIVIANHLPAAVRGRMKLWFIEPRPNVFVSGVKNSVAKSVTKYLYKHCSPDSGLLIISKINTVPGYFINSIGNTKPIYEISGLQLVLEKLVDQTPLIKKDQ